jgi:pimeloyl-ACP methyl ester carboxylesterase
VLAIRGEHSDTFRVAAAERLNHKIADFELTTIADAGHFVPMGKPQECAQAIAEFIQRKLGGPDK